MDVEKIDLGEFATAISHSSTEVAKAIADKLDRMITLHNKQVVTIDELKAATKRRVERLRLMRKEIAYKHEL